MINFLAATPDVMWPANHKMVAVGITAMATDNCGAATDWRIGSVTSSEPQQGLGDGDTSPDWEITGPLTVNLRAERAGSGSGRVYSLLQPCHPGSSQEAGCLATSHFCAAARQMLPSTIMVAPAGRHSLISRNK